MGASSRRPRHGRGRTSLWSDDIEVMKEKMGGALLRMEDGFATTPYDTPCGSTSSSIGKRIGWRIGWRIGRRTRQETVALNLATSVDSRPSALL